MKQQIYRVLGVLCCFLLAISSVQAAQYESLIELQRKVEEFLITEIHKNNPKADLSVKVKGLDPRLHLHRCKPDNLRLSAPHNRQLINSSTVSVKCLAPHHWSIYVPVQIQMLKKVVVTDKHISKNQQFTSDDIKIIKVDIMKVRQGYFSRPEEVIGKVAKRRISPNRIINPINLKLAKLISKGDIVSITAITDGIKVTVKGMALQQGRLGEMINVKNLTSKKIIEAKVVSNKDVLIKM
jgi:flagella basal body P-ring formation protein FlgA